MCNSGVCNMCDIFMYSILDCNFWFTFGELFFCSEKGVIFTVYFDRSDQQSNSLAVLERIMFSAYLSSGIRFSPFVNRLKLS